MPRLLSCWSRVTLGLLSLWLAGCDKVPSLEDAKNAISGGVDQAAQVADNAAESVKQASGAAGAMELELDRPLKTSGCYVSLHTFSDGRPSVLQITSYHHPSGESFPSVILRGTTDAKSLAELNGQRISAQAFLQEQPDGPVWQAIDKPLELTITGADNSTLTGRLQGTLTNLETDATQDAAGSFSGAAQPR